MPRTDAGAVSRQGSGDAHAGFARARSEGTRAALWLPLVTPMRGGELDLTSAQRLAAHYVASGVDGPVILGTTGEGGLLSPAERLMFAAAVLEAGRSQAATGAGQPGVARAAGPGDLLAAAGRGCTKHFAAGLAVQHGVARTRERTATGRTR
jgi:4-hydroxy-tetrahydrodipicolinate synthase